MEYLAAYANYLVDNAPALVGFVLPVVVDYLNKDVPNERERFLVTVFVCLVTGTLLKWHDIAYGSPEAAVASTSIVFLESQVIYRTYFKTAWLRGKLLSLYTPKEETAPVTQVATETLPVGDTTTSSGE